MRKTWGRAVDTARKSCVQVARFSHTAHTEVLGMFTNTPLFTRLVRTIPTRLSTPKSAFLPLLSNSFTHNPQHQQIRLQTEKVNTLVVIVIGGRA